MQFSPGNYVMNIYSNKTAHISLNMVHKAQCYTARIQVSFQINHNHEVVPKEILHILIAVNAINGKETVFVFQLISMQVFVRIVFHWYFAGTFSSNPSRTNRIKRRSEQLVLLLFKQQKGKTAFIVYNLGVSTRLTHAQEPTRTWTYISSHCEGRKLNGSRIMHSSTCWNLWVSCTHQFIM